MKVQCFFYSVLFSQPPLFKEGLYKNIKNIICSYVPENHQPLMQLWSKALLAIGIAVHPEGVGWSWGQSSCFSTPNQEYRFFMTHMTLCESLRLELRGPSPNSLIPRVNGSQLTGVLTGFLYSFLQLTTCERADPTECTPACHIWHKCCKWGLYSCKDRHWRVEYKSSFQQNRRGWSSGRSQRPWLTSFS